MRVDKQRIVWFQTLLCDKSYLYVIELNSNSKVECQTCIQILHATIDIFLISFGIDIQTARILNNSTVYFN